MLLAVALEVVFVSSSSAARPTISLAADNDDMLLSTEVADNGNNNSSIGHDCWKWVRYPLATENGSSLKPPYHARATNAICQNTTMMKYATTC
jgi:hypothetical protein